jgi:hypothetical protein
MIKSSAVGWKRHVERWAIIKNAYSTIVGKPSITTENAYKYNSWKPPSTLEEAYSSTV